MKKRVGIFIAGVFCWATVPLFGSEKETVSCGDHPLFVPLAGYVLTECQERDRKEVEFVQGKDKDIKVEGRYHQAEYQLKPGRKAPSDLAVLRHYQQAAQKVGGTVTRQKIATRKGETQLRVPKDGKTYWVKVESSHGGQKYEVTVVEKVEPQMEAQQDASLWAHDLETAGRAAVYGIRFGFNKAAIQPESEPTLKEIAKLLEENPRLKLFVVGHTDNLGSIEYNLRLSTLRAKAVVAALTTRYRISPHRLKAYGLGSLAPVATNKTEEGRAKNRRVELVEQ